MQTLNVGLLLLAILMSGCKTQEAVTENVQAEIQVVKDLLQQYEDLVNQGDIDGLMALYTDDVIRLAPDQPLTRGTDSIRSEFLEFSSQYNHGGVDVSVEDIIVSGHLAFVRTSYTESWSPKTGGEENSVTGKWVVIYKKQDGEWKLYTEIWNLDAPLKPGALLSEKAAN